MHKLRSPGGRRGIGVHVARIAALSAALLTMTGIVVEDVIAAEPGAQAMLLLLEEGMAGADSEVLAPVLLAAAVIVPDVMLVPEPEPEPEPELGEKPEPPRKKKRSRIKFGRFEGY